jgi:hypothetical protein
MTHAAILVTIDPDEPINVLEVADILDNEYWKFCADDPSEEQPTFDEFDLGPEFILPAGTVVQTEYLWGWGSSGVSEPTDYQITLPRAAPVKYVVHFLLSAYHDRLKQQGVAGRFLYIEQVSMRDGVCMIDWGT